jgi:hypothetical protein
VALLSCILIRMGVSCNRVVCEAFFERYTRLLMAASPEFPIYFLKIYSPWLVPSVCGVDRG